MKKVIIYTDGACRGNPGPGSWGVLLQSGKHEKTISGVVEMTTNNRMELMAAIEALKLIKEKCMIELHTDSQYLQKGMTDWLPRWKQRAWKKADNKPIKNIDLWQALDDQIKCHQVKWYWVKAHDGHPENERVDKLANQALDDFEKGKRE